MLNFKIIDMVGEVESDSPLAHAEYQGIEQGIWSLTIEHNEKEYEIEYCALSGEISYCDPTRVIQRHLDLAVSLKYLITQQYIIDGELWSAHLVGGNDVALTRLIDHKARIITISELKGMNPTAMV